MTLSGPGVSEKRKLRSQNEIGRCRHHDASHDIIVPNSILRPSVTAITCPRSQNSRRKFESSERTLSGAASTTSITPHGNGLLVSLDGLKVGNGTVELHAADRLGDFAGVLEGHTEEGTTGLSGVGGVDSVNSVADLKIVTNTCQSYVQSDICPYVQSNPVPFPLLFHKSSSGFNRIDSFGQHFCSLRACAFPTLIPLRSRTQFQALSPKFLHFADKSNRVDLPS